MSASHRHGPPRWLLLLCGVAIVVYIIWTSSHRAPEAPEIAAPPATDDFSDGRDEITVDLKDGTTDAELQAFALRHHTALRWASKEPSILRAAIAIATADVSAQPRLLAEL